MEHIKAASKQALRAGPSPRIEPGQQLINRFSKIAATLPDPPETPKPPVIPPLRPHSAYREVDAGGNMSDAKGSGGWGIWGFLKGLGGSGSGEGTKVVIGRSGSQGWGSLLSGLYKWTSFENLIPIVVIGGTILILIVMFIKKRMKPEGNDRALPFVPIDLPAYSREDKESFVATSDSTHADLAGLAT